VTANVSAADLLPDTYRVRVVHSAGSNFTYSVERHRADLMPRERKADAAMYARVFEENREGQLVLEDLVDRFGGACTCAVAKTAGARPTSASGKRAVLDFIVGQVNHATASHHRRRPIPNRPGDPGFFDWSEPMKHWRFNHVFRNEGDAGGVAARVRAPQRRSRRSRSGCCWRWRGGRRRRQRCGSWRCWRQLGAAAAASALAAGAAAGGAGAAGGAAAGAGAAGGAEARHPGEVRRQERGGQVDHAATALKLAREGYLPLEKRLGSGDAPPQTVDGYKVNVPEALKDKIDAEELAKDEGFKGFMGKLHAAGASQKVVDAAVATMLERGIAMREAMPALQASECEATLRQADGWKTDQEYTGRCAPPSGGPQIFGEAFKGMEAKGYFNDPDFIRGLATIGREMQEDRGPSPEAQQQLNTNLDALMSSPAYLNPNHPQARGDGGEGDALTAQMCTATSRCRRPHDLLQERVTRRAGLRQPFSQTMAAIHRPAMASGQPEHQPARAHGSRCAPVKLRPRSLWTTCKANRTRSTSGAFNELPDPRNMVQQYANNFRVLYQQKAARLRPWCQIEAGIVGQSKSTERLGKAEAYDITSRHADTKFVEVPHSRRWLDLGDKGWAELIDKLDKVRLLADPTRATPRSPWRR
jgi:hypothetical protein